MTTKLIMDLSKNKHFDLFKTEIQSNNIYFNFKSLSGIQKILVSINEFRMQVLLTNPISKSVYRHSKNSKATVRPCLKPFLLTPAMLHAQDRNRCLDMIETFRDLFPIIFLLFAQRPDGLSNRAPFFRRLTFWRNFLFSHYHCRSTLNLDGVSSAPLWYVHRFQHHQTGFVFRVIFWCDDEHPNGSRASERIPICTCFRIGFVEAVRTAARATNIETKAKELKLITACISATKSGVCNDNWMAKKCVWLHWNGLCTGCNA